MFSDIQIFLLFIECQMFGTAKKKPDFLCVPNHTGNMVVSVSWNSLKSDFLMCLTSNCHNKMMLLFFELKESQFCLTGVLGGFSRVFSFSPTY